MIIIGVDYHPAFQQIALLDTATGEFQEKRLGHREEAEAFYRVLATTGETVRAGMKASGHARWFERLLAELHIELWIGDAAQIRARQVRKQKTDRQDAELILKLMLQDEFPQIRVPSWENRIYGSCCGTGIAWCRHVPGSFLKMILMSGLRLIFALRFVPLELVFARRAMKRSPGTAEGSPS